MPRGGPDGDQQNYLFANQETDLGAVYQYLWGFAPIDSGGRPMYFDTFNNGLMGWGLNQTGSGSLPTLSQAQGLIYSPPNAAKLTAGIVTNDSSVLFRTFYMGTTKRIGIEVGLQLGNTTPNYRFSLDYKPAGLPAFYMGIEWDHATGVFRTQPGGFTIKTLTVPGGGNNLFMQVKIVGDWTTGKFVRALLGDQLFDLSSQSLFSSGNTYNGMGIANVQALSYGAGSSDGYIGYVLYTRDEP